jgi:hypothetical protein
MAKEPPILEYHSSEKSAGVRAIPDPHLGRRLLWWLPAIALILAGAFTDPDRIGVRSKSTYYAFLLETSGWCFTLGALYVPSMLIFRAIAHARRQRRKELQRKLAEIDARRNAK